MDNDRSTGRPDHTQTAGCAASIVIHSGKVIGALGLPSQQARIVEILMQGKQDKQIAREMGLKLPTVRSHLRRLFDRMGTSSRVGLVLAIMTAACKQCGSGQHPGNRYHHK